MKRELIARKIRYLNNRDAVVRGIGGIVFAGAWITIYLLLHFRK
jgi:hypothetical protein